MRTIILVIAGVLAAFGASVAPGCAQPPDPYQIFAKARAYWDRQRYPQFIDYETVVEVRDGSADRVERYDSAYDTDSGSVWIDPVSDYERAHPASGRGFGGWNQSQGPHAAPDIDFIGLPLLAPNYSFALAHHAPYAMISHPPTNQELVAQIRAELHDPNPHRPAPPQESGLREITAVTAIARDYTISLDGIENVDGDSCYHLSLAPRADPGQFRLRDAWIDTQTFATERIRTGLNFIDGPGTHMPWTIDFADVGGARYIARESADGVYKYGGKTYSAVTISFEQIVNRTAPFPFQIAPPAVFLTLEEP